MICTSPLCKAELNTIHLTKDGKLTPDVKFLDIDSYDKGLYDEDIGIGKKYKRIYPIACQQCISCRLNYSRDKATQMMLETKEHPENESWFITVTYNDEHLPHYTTKMILEDEYKKITGISLDKTNFQTFWKRVNKRYGKGVKKVYVGEYGSLTNRPHGHAIVWGLPLDLTRLKKWDVNEFGDPIWRCEELEELWHDAHLRNPKPKKGDCMGNIMVARVNWNTCAYVARYTLKKSLRAHSNEEYAKYYQAQGKRPEYIVWSNGVGRKYFNENYEKIYLSDTVPVINKKTGQPVQPPTSYDRILEKIDPELFKSIKEKRWKQAETLNHMDNLENPFSPMERRAIAEARMKAITQDFREKEI